MVTINGNITKPSGEPAITPFKVWLVNYGTDISNKLYVSPEPQTVTPDANGDFTFDVWANIEADVPCYYRVQFDFGLTLKLSVPPSDTPLEFTSLIVDESIENLPGVLSRVSKLESTGGVVIPSQNFILGGWLTGTPAAYDGTSSVTLIADSIDANGLVNTVPASNLEGSYDISLDNPLTFGSGLTGSSSSYNGYESVTLGVNFSQVVATTDPRLSDTREWVASTVTQLEAEAGTGIGRRAWTPQRVFQAITSWFSTSPQGIKLEGIQEGAEVNTVSSVAGQTGEVTLEPADVGLGNVQNVNQTDASNLLTGTVNSALVEDISGNAPTATRLASPFNINGIAVDGSESVTVPLVFSLNFGTGLVSGSFNGLSDETLQIDTSVVVSQTDPRLSDAREWSASTATQAESESGTLTARRAFTPQRIFQAIASWWASSAFASKLAGIESGAQVNTISSVAGKTGIITLVPGDVGLGNVPNVNATNAANISSGTINSARVQNISGNAPTATKWATSRIITIGDTPKPLDGSGNVSWTLSEIDPNIVLLSAGTQVFLGNKTFNTTGNELILIDSGGDVSNYFWARPSVSQLLIGSSALKPVFRADVLVDRGTPSTSKTTGALKVSGGLGVGGDIYCTNLVADNIPVTTGTFTPILYNLSDNSEPTYTAQFGQWWRNGNDVKFTIRIVLPAQSGLTSGFAAVGNLPFPRANSATEFDSITLFSWNVFTGLETSLVTGGVTASATPYIRFFAPISTGGGALGINFNTLKDGWLRFSGSYKTS